MITLIEIDGNVQGDSETTVSIGTGLKIFTLTDNEPFVEGSEVIARYDDSNYMSGVVLTQSNQTLTLDIDAIVGSGSYSNWVIDAPRTLYFATETYISKDTDSPSNQEYSGDIRDPGEIGQYMFSAAQTSGRSRITRGTIRIANFEKKWNFIRKLGFASGALRIKQIDSINDPLPSVNIFAGTVLYPEIGETVDFEVSDRLADLDVPVTVETFLGTNAGSTGIEGSENGIKGYIKPFSLGGPIIGVNAYLVNEASRIYALNFDYSGNTEAVTSIESVLDNGLEKTKDTTVGTSGDVADLATLQSATIAPGKYITCLAEGLIRLEGNPEGVVTVNFTESTMTGGDLIKSMVERIGLTSGDYNSDSFDQLDIDSPGYQQLYDDLGETVYDLSQSVIDGMGGYLIANIQNEIEAGIFKTATGMTSERTYDASNSHDIKTLKSRDHETGLPPKQIKINHSKNYSPIDESQFAVSVTQTSRIRQSNEWLEVAGNVDENLKRKHPKAPVYAINSHFTSDSDASTELTRQETLKQNDDQTFYEFTTTDLYGITLGKAVTLQIDGDPDLDSGLLGVVMGKEYNLSDSTITYIIRGEHG